MISPREDLPPSSSAEEPALESAVQSIDSAFRAFVQDPDFPCLGGKSVVNVNQYTLRVYGALGKATNATSLVADLLEFGASFGNRGLSAFVAVFPAAPPEEEISFERRLWQQLQAVHETDSGRGEWSEDVSDDPDDPRFSFSVGGKAFFVVGLHPVSSRLARRFRWPTLVFNPHEQFTRLREEGRFESLRSAIRQRDIALQGTMNPNVADFGEESEARQYSGRKTEPGWKCPFHRLP
jgi:FPC/CPF motif-containing protein YcgG